jgi:signal transduction histidine kinase
MKMKFWQKTYFFTLILFLICLNIGILSLTVYTHQKNIEAAETTASAEHNYIALSFERDYNSLMSDNPNATVTLLMQSFSAHYGNKGLYLAFEENGRVLCTNFSHDYQTSQNTITHTKFDGQRHILISTDICDGAYTLVYGKNIESLHQGFRGLMVTYVTTALVISAVLAICLYFILRQLSKPLDRLKATTERIEKGDFSATAQELGNDEFTMLARSFNSMLATINHQMDALETDAKQKQMLVDNMAHELRTPLTSIHGYGEFLEKAAATEEQRIIAAKYILSESERLQKISEILLDSAYIRENPPEMASVDVSKILLDVAEKLEGKATACGVTLTHHGQPLDVCGNETLLSMLFYNLTDNAIKACCDGGIVQLRWDEGRIFILDNGKGMTPEQLQHITEPFYRTDKSRSRAEGGAGLGLALCQQIIQVHGWKMEFESQVEAGTKITLTFTTSQ